MANKTNNYKLPKPEVDDFYDISEYNKTMDMLDDSLTEMDEKKLDKNGDASEAVTEFEQEILRENIESGETLSSTFGKVKKWFSEMKDVAFSGHAKDVATDAAHRFVSDAEKSSWNGKVGASGGDISETVIGTLESIDSKYPVPAYGETAKVFMGKVKKFINDTKPLNAEMFVEVANSGSDTTGDGTLSKPYRTIQYALNTIPKDLNGYSVTIRVGDGTYNEEVHLSGYKSGSIIIRRSGPIILNAICNIQSIYVSDCHSVSIQGINLTSTGRDCVMFYKCDYAEAISCKSIENGSGYTSYTFDNVNNGKIVGCMSKNYDICLKITGSNVFSNSWDQYALGNNFGIIVKDGGTLVKGEGYQPPGQIQDEFIQSTAGIILNRFGASIGTLLSDLSLYVSPTGSDITGVGTKQRPFKTIQRAVNSLPKDLGGFMASIVISDGTYVEDVLVSNFYNGYVIIQRNISNQVINNLCNVRSVRVKYCTAMVDIQGMNITAGNIEGVSISFSSLVTIFRCQSIVDDGSINSAAFKFEYCTKGRVVQCHTQNKNTAIIARNTEVLSDTWDNSSSTKGTALISVEAASIITTGTQPSSPSKNTVQYSGGSFVKDNGTQISGIISSGLSCTWGIITGGYVRHGNLNGVAMVTICTRVITTVQLSAYTNYVIHGYPKPMNINHCVSTNLPSATRNCYLSTDNGSLVVQMTMAVVASDVLEFNCTYITNS